MTHAKTQRHKERPKMRCFSLPLAAVLALVSTAGVADGTRPAEEFRIVPVRVHLLRSEVAPAVNTKLQAADVARIFRKANNVWQPAGIHFWVETVVDEKAINAEARRDDAVLTLDSLPALRPAASRAEGMFHVYYVGAMSVNGVYMARDSIFVQEAAKLRPVEGGIDEPLPRVTSHELGHAMGLPHRQDRTNLMASGTTGTSLNDAEIEKVRLTTHVMRWILPADEFEKEAEKNAADGKKDLALSQLRSVAELQGKSGTIDRAHAALHALEK
jgi:hypothetical protein